MTWQSAWDSDKPAESCRAEFDRRREQAWQALLWYRTSVKAKKWWAQHLRVVAIVTGALAAIVPTLSQMQIGSGAAGPSAMGVVQPAVTYILLGIAALALAIDRFFGCSSAWMRFIRAEQDVDRLVSDFELDVAAEQASWPAEGPSQEQLQRALALCKSFTRSVADVVRSETDAWIVEFRSSLQEIDASARIKPSAGAKSGGINVSLTNPEVAPAGWTVRLDGGAERKASGRTLAVSEVSPGPHSVRADAKADGKTLSAESAVTVAPGEVLEVQLKLH